MQRHVNKGLKCSTCAGRDIYLLFFMPVLKRHMLFSVQLGDTLAFSHSAMHTGDLFDLISNNGVRTPCVCAFVWVVGCVRYGVSLNIDRNGWKFIRVHTHTLTHSPKPCRYTSTHRDAPKHWQLLHVTTQPNPYSGTHTFSQSTIQMRPYAVSKAPTPTHHRHTFIVQRYT